MTVSYDLTCWYLNARRVIELTGYTPVPSSGDLMPHIQKLQEKMQLKDCVVTWMRKNNPRPLEIQLLDGMPQKGAIFTHDSTFFFSGLPEVNTALHKNKTPKPARAYSKLDEWLAGGRIEFEFHHDHLTSQSSWTELSGKKKLFVLGLVTDIQGCTIKCAPYVIANIVEPSSSDCEFIVEFYLSEIHIDDIDTFQNVKTIKGKLNKASLDQLKDVPEAEIKKAFAEIINEPSIPKDWGGEKSDLFTSRVMLKGQRISTAFLFKGPAKFHAMTPSDLGKNGDQIGRLFSEPANLLILQHCHEVTPAVRSQMRAYAQQMGNPRKFCIVDGYDTLRILRAYGKCGFSADVTARARTQ